MALTQSPPAELRYAWRVLSVTGLGMWVTFSSVSMVPLALPHMVGDLRAGSAQADWFVLAYQLVTAVLMLPLGRLSDVLGRRTMYVGGLALVTASTLAICFCTAPEPVIALRAVQGVGAAAVITNTTALLVDAFPPSHVSRGIGWNITIMSTAVALGPLLGGLLTEAFGWRGVFALSVPLALAGTVWSAVALRRTRPITQGRIQPDVGGILASVVGVGGIVLAVNRVGDGVGSVTFLIPLAAAVLGVASFVAIERRVPNPILDLRLVLVRFRGSAYATTALLNLGLSAGPLLVSLYLQSLHGLTALSAGLCITAQACGNIVVGPLAGRWAARTEARVLATAGAFVAVAGAALLATVSALGGGGPAVAGAMFVMGLGNGIFQTTNASVINIGVRPWERGMANGFRVMIDNSAALLGSAIALVLITSGLPHALRSDALAGATDGFGPADLAAFAHAFPLTIGALAVLSLVAVCISALRGRTPHPEEET
ncbi:MFS transporter [Pseudonocardia kujensis]|uniref:MFS transporter n=1 Tax=Pseudonocardia kujensis TaxID=1128675 RepID=UPI001E616E4F|nr:MFS transporter [Pseudonocardia kujensis]MCE0766865.1 MFS transporter [Pseudonocardia kujensis]